MDGLTILLIGLSMISAYLLGSINFAIIFTYIAKGVDIRKFGSGNAGFTNVLRSVGKWPAILTLICDFLKGIVAVFIVRLLLLFFANIGDFVIADYLVCYCALLGHVYPIFYGFKGGKGILVSFGALMVLSPIAGLMCLFTFLIALIISKYISVGSIIAAIAYPLSILTLSLLTKSDMMLECLLAIPISLFIIFMHRQNIVRLVNHTESKVSVKKK